MNVTFSKKVSAGIISAFLLLPIFAFAQDVNPTVNPNKDTQPKNAIVYVCTGGAPGECTFGDVLSAIQHLVNFGVEFALMFSVIVIAVAGGKYMISGGNSGERAKANAMLMKVVTGIIIIMAAWLIVTLITGALLNPNINTFLSNVKK